jgi:hypothetical protein
VPGYSWRKQQPAQGHAPTLAAGQGLDPGFPGRQTQRVHGHLEPPVQLPGVRGLDLVLQPALLLEELLHGVVFQGLGEARRDLLEAVEQGPHLGDPLLHAGLDGLVRIELGLLGQVTDADVVGMPGLPREVAIEAGHDAQQRALAGPVRAKDADLRARQEGQRDPVEDDAALAHHLAQIFEREHELVGHDPSW